MNNLKCMRRESFSCSSCFLSHSEFTHIIKGYNKTEGIKYSVLITCKFCNSIVFKGDFFEKFQNPRLLFDKAEFEYVFHSGDNNNKIIT